MEKSDVFSFDSRRKVLVRTIKESDKVHLDNKDIGTYRIKNEQEYDVDGVKAILAELKSQEDKIQHFLADRNRTIEAEEHRGDMTDEEKHLKELLVSIQAKERLEKAKQERLNMLPQLEEIRKQRLALYDALGTFRNLVE